ncbi:hypothetical protein CLOSTMETH_02612 [[Clostridium] methylpentosum DSM 5476]|uniref:Uncharacterized protein n=1 Tax=[Clostridium] methylpentosum DSM 5476 TaxID=537013 RepID=C0EFH0_9FIRM|nr:hypothetical protein CLOSTMETH_02612 [[Clostridium] methylpentosum DSM 5476]
MELLFERRKSTVWAGIPGPIGLNQYVLQDNIQPTALWIAGEKNSFAQGTAGAILKKPKALEVCVTHHLKAVLG